MTHDEMDLGQHQLLTPRQAAAILGLTPRFLEMRRFKGGGPVFIRVSGRCVRYRLSDLIEWIEGRRRTSTSDQGEGGNAKAGGFGPR